MRKTKKVFSNLAISLDGKIADLSTPEKMLGTPLDRQTMLKIRTKADVVVFGAETLRVIKKCVKIPASKRKRQIVNAVVTQSGRLSPQMSFWEDPDVIRFIFTTEKSFQRALKASRDRAFVVSAGKDRVDPKLLLRRLYQSNLHRVLVEGGGGVMRSFLDAKALDEMHVTLTPWIISGNENPCLVSGAKTMLPWTKLKLLQSKKVRDEVYLHYKVRK